MPPEENRSCKICEGKGVIDVDDLHTILCACSRRRLFKVHMGPEIFGSQHVESPLYIPGTERDKPLVDKTKSNIFIRSSWRRVLPHLKWVIFHKTLNYRFRIVTDERILMVRLGKESFAVKSKADKEALDKAYNTLGDLLGEQDLVIIRLGFLGYKNIAAPGYLKEALMIREVANKPTWIIEDPSQPFASGADHHTYSEEVAEYIWNHFSVLDLASDGGVEETAKRPSPVRPILEDEDPVTGSQGVLSEESRPSVDEEEDNSSETDNSMESAVSVFEITRSKPKKNKWKKW